MKKYQLPKTLYLQEHAIWLLRKVKNLKVATIDALIESIESELIVLKAIEAKSRNSPLVPSHLVTNGDRQP